MPRTNCTHTFSHFFRQLSTCVGIVMYSSYLNILLIFVPLGILSSWLNWNAWIIFIVNFTAIIPLASLLSFATEELSAKLGQTLGGLINSTFGNAVELIISMIALSKNEIQIVQSSMLGSVLSNILLVLGTCFVAAGIHGGEQSFNETAASTMSSLMAVSCASLIIPATLYNVVSKVTSSTLDDILILSRGTSIILLLLYALYLFFQLRSHAYLFDEQPLESIHLDNTTISLPQSADASPNHHLKPLPAFILLALVSLATAVCAEYLVDSIDGVVSTGIISKPFVGLILIPLVGNATEHVTACIVAYKGKMDLAINVAIGSSMQIALFVTPFMVIFGWIIGCAMTLQFQSFETMVFFLSVLLVNYLIRDGKSNYLEGAMCIGIYIIISLAFYVYPDQSVHILVP